MGAWDGQGNAGANEAGAIAERGEVTARCRRSRSRRSTAIASRATCSTTTRRCGWTPITHARVRGTISPLVDSETRAWLEHASAPIAA
jgi:hypothetical protein